MTPGEVAALFHVNTDTVASWATSGKLDTVRTPGGHRRYREDQVRALLDGKPVYPIANDPARTYGWYWACKCHGWRGDKYASPLVAGVEAPAEHARIAAARGMQRAAGS